MARLLAVLFVILGGILGASWWGYSQFDAPGPSTVPITVVIAKGGGVRAIAHRLADVGVIRHPTVFRIAVRLSGADTTLKAGEYAFPAGASARDVLNLLVSGKTVVRKLTIAEGLTTRQVLDIIRGAEGLVGRITRSPAEGALWPETYHYSWGDERDALVRRMTVADRREIDGLWARRAPGLPLTSINQAITLASIVEKETALPEERAHVAGVFFNRLKRGMRLQSDPTVVYGLSAGEGTLGRALTYQDLHTATPYNTYMIKGLPPGPICNPGRASIMAVLHPQSTPDIYFVANGRGGHAFAQTLQEHNANVRRWRKTQQNDNGS
ncbi:endolytic transglycosylase MltG [Varunaivibrio sulfuroxidans]|uniref:Endolytic murein transglycosylase n=1 Tax=Varunaivibrio sulfuroxidans TaxID=1773489 RepID=A0A4R3J4K9_9PROT|nr:endolytic transglycosylase MltG [Varunaivibrio sulfuroxidans]TCS60124.1 UPF0755 protein [Varunaivibrio sulfuroxidans]WES30903.1 endolytic transglycosylase MltG [Varunaivibrio sulfuroxidans]